MKKTCLLILFFASLQSLAVRSDMVFSYEDLGGGCARITGRSGQKSDDVVIPPVIDGLIVTEIGDPTSGAASFKGDPMKTLALPDTLREIQTYTFQGCTNLTMINFGRGVTYIGGGAFMKCRALTKLLIPASVSALGGSVFANCSALTKVIFLGNAPSVNPASYQGTPTALVSYACTGTTGWKTAGSTELPSSWPSVGNGRTIKNVAPNYTIEYLANGGTGTMSAQTCEYGRVCQLKKSTFTKTGKRFAGWTLVGTSRRYDNGLLIFNLAWPGETISLEAIYSN